MGSARILQLASFGSFHPLYLAITVKFFIHVPFSGSPYGVDIVGPALDLAFNNLANRFPNQNLSFEAHRQIFPSLAGCDRALSVMGQMGAHFYFQLVQGRVGVIPAMFVAGCNPIMSFTGDYAREINALFVTCVASDSSMHDKNRFPTLTRFIPYEPVDVAFCFLAVLAKFSWYHTTLIYDKSSILVYYHSIGSTLNDLLRADHNFHPAYYAYDSQERGSPNFTRYLTKLRSTCRVVLLSMSMMHVRDLLIAAYKAGMTNGEFVYIATWPFYHERYGNMSWQYGKNEEEDRMALAAFQSLLIIVPRIPNNTDYSKFETPAKWTPAKHAHNHTDNYEINRHALDTYTAITESAKAYASLLMKGGNISDGLAVAREMWGTTLNTDVSGEVTIDQNGDKVVEYGLLAFNNRTGKFTEVYLFLADLWTLVNVPGETIPWASGDPPPDKPKCGFTGHMCFWNESSRAQAIWLPSLFGSFGVFVTAITAVFIKRQQKKRDGESIWLLNSSGITLWTTKDYPLDISSPTYTKTDGERLSWSSSAIFGSKKHRAAVYCRRFVWMKTLFLTHSYVPRVEEKNLLREWVKVSHRCVVPFLGLMLGHLEVTVVTEFRRKGSLRDFLDNGAVKPDIWLKMSFLNDLISGLLYLHFAVFGQHGNLKSFNCIVDNYFTLQMTDLSFCQFPVDMNDVPDASFYKQRLWRAPEVLRCNSLDKKAADVFSVGIIIQEIFVQAYPYTNPDDHHHSIDPHEVHDRLVSVCSPPFRWNMWKNCSDNIKALVSRCCEEVPEKRPTISRLRAMLGMMEEHRSSKNLLDNMLTRMEKYAEDLECAVSKKTEELFEEKRRSEKLLLEIFPPCVAERLVNGTMVLPEWYESVTVCFTGLDNFTFLTATCTPHQIVILLNDLYSVFDASLVRHDVYKVESVADSYMVASGLPGRNGTQHVRHIACLAQSLLEVGRKFRPKSTSIEELQLKLGISTGPVATGIVGVRSPRYCLFGDTVNMASRMASSGEALRIQVSASYKVALDRFPYFRCELRGLTEIKGKQKELTYWLLPKNDPK